MANPIEFEFRATGAQDVERAFDRIKGKTGELDTAQKSTARSAADLGASMTTAGQKAGQFAGVFNNIGAVAGRLSPQLGSIAQVVGQIGTATTAATAAFGPWGIAIGLVTAALGALVPALDNTERGLNSVERAAIRAADRIRQAADRIRQSREDFRLVAGAITGTGGTSQIEAAIAAEQNRIQALQLAGQFGRDTSADIQRAEQQIEFLNSQLEAARAFEQATSGKIERTRAAAATADALEGKRGRRGGRGGGGERGLNLGGFASDDDIAALAAGGVGGLDADLVEVTFGAGEEDKEAARQAAEERRLEAARAYTAELKRQLEIQNEQNAKLADTGRLITGLLVEGIQLANEENTTLLQGIASRLDKELEAFAIKEVLEGGAATAVAIGNAIFNPPLAATKALEAAKHFALAAAAGGASLAIPDGGGGGGGGGSARANPAGAGAPAGVVGGGGGPSTIVVNFNSPVAEAEIGRQQERAARAARRSYGARV